jgi:hypothetical protein
MLLKVRLSPAVVKRALLSVAARSLVDLFVLEYLPGVSHICFGVD